MWLSVTAHQSRHRAKVSAACKNEVDQDCTDNSTVKGCSSKIVCIGTTTVSPVALPKCKQQTLAVLSVLQPTEVDQVYGVATRRYDAMSSQKCSVMGHKLFMPAGRRSTEAHQNALTMAAGKAVANTSFPAGLQPTKTDQDCINTGIAEAAAVKAHVINIPVH